MIGIFDSGSGGLSVFREIRRLLPEESYIYYSDNAHCPYGEKTKEYITDRAREITDFLLSKGAEIIVVACNTATAAAISTLRNEYNVPFIGMEPAVKPAAAQTKTGTVGVLATAGTSQHVENMRKKCVSWSMWEKDLSNSSRAASSREKKQKRQSEEAFFLCLKQAQTPSFSAAHTIHSLRRPLQRSLPDIIPNVRQA